MMYELHYLIDPTVADTEIVIEKDKIVALIQKNQGTVKHEETPQKRKLAYEMKQIKMGWYGSFQFESEGSMIQTVRSELSLFTSGLRFLITKYIEQRKRISSSPPRTPQELGQNEPEQERKEVNLDELDQKLEKILHDQPA